MEAVVGPKQKEIDGIIYKVDPFLGVDNLLHFLTLTKILGKPLAELVISAISESSKKKAESPVGHLSNFLDSELEDYIPAVANAFSVLTEKLQPAEFLAFIQALLKNTREISDSGEKVINFDLHFAGARLKHLFKVLMFILEVNFSDFLSGGLDFGQTIKSFVSSSEASPTSPEAQSQ